MWDLGQYSKKTEFYEDLNIKDIYILNPILFFFLAKPIEFLYTSLGINASECQMNKKKRTLAGFLFFSLIFFETYFGSFVKIWMLNDPLLGINTLKIIIKVKRGFSVDY